MRGKILIIEDDRGLREVLHRQFEEYGFEVEVAKNGEEGLECYDKSRPDLVLTDIMMPRLDGFSVCREIRKTDPVTPVVFLSCFDDEAQQVRALELGAVHFISKSDIGSARLSPAMFAAMLDRHIRRTHELVADGGSVFAIGGVEVDTESLSLRGVGIEAKLTSSEADLLKALNANRGRCVGYDRLIDLLRGEGFAIDPHAIVQVASRVKRKLGIAGDRIRNVRNRGYALDA